MFGLRSALRQRRTGREPRSVVGTWARLQVVRPTPPVEALVRTTTCLQVHANGTQLTYVSSIRVCTKLIPRAE